MQVKFSSGGWIKWRNSGCSMEIFFTELNRAVWNIEYLVFLIYRFIFAGGSVPKVHLVMENYPVGTVTRSGRTTDIQRKKNIGEMESQRQSKVSRLIQKELADIFQKQGNSLFGGGMISVTVVRVTPDLGLARVYVSLFPPERKQELFDSVNAQVKTIRHELGRRVKNQLRLVPELQFFVDDSIDYARRIDDLLNS